MNPRISMRDFVHPLRHEEPKDTAFYSSSLTPSWSFKMNIFDPVTNPLPPTLPPHQPMPEKGPLGEVLTTVKYQKETDNARKHQNSAKKIFPTSSLMEGYRQSVIIHINSTEHIRSYTS